MTYTCNIHVKSRDEAWGTVEQMFPCGVTRDDAYDNAGYPVYRFNDGTGRIVEVDWAGGHWLEAITGDVIQYIIIRTNPDVMNRFAEMIQCVQMGETPPYQQRTAVNPVAGIPSNMDRWRTIGNFPQDVKHAIYHKIFLWPLTALLGISMRLVWMYLTNAMTVLNLLFIVAAGIFCVWMSLLDFSKAHAMCDNYVAQHPQYVVRNWETGDWAA